MPFLLTLNETPQDRIKKERAFEYYKGILYNHAKSACNHMIKRCENDNVDWKVWTYKNVPVERKMRAYRQLRKFAGISDIPTYRCESYWLEKKLIEKFYRHKPRKTIKKTNNGGSGKGKEKERDVTWSNQVEDDEQQQQSQEDDEEALSWDSDLEQFADQGEEEDNEDQLFDEGDEEEGPSSQPPAKRRDEISSDA
ncbi:hypothetical protein EDC96DRAFT_534506 [Choanephora cucurbitarum]|nr:hypothetical protein EDC96DRAFT_534506 [Choanephora cucurbitarum]